jgi:metal-dependent amidase/aminoacylase/carboxypeptidase family protein
MTQQSVPYDDALIAQLTTLRRDLHRAPEISGEEQATAEHMAQ